VNLLLKSNNFSVNLLLKSNNFIIFNIFFITFIDIEINKIEIFIFDIDI